VLPEWLALGLLIAGAASVVAAALFVLGEWLYPTEPVKPARSAPGVEAPPGDPGVPARH